MFITIQNVGAITKASVDLNGLTVIAGKNGTGKSTIGKTIYTIIKSIQEQEKIFIKKQKEFIDWACKNIYFSLQGTISRNTNKNTSKDKDLELLESLFQFGAFERSLNQYIDEKNLDSALMLIKSRYIDVDKFSKIIDDETKIKTREILKAIEDRLSPINNEKEAQKLSLITMYQSVFDGQINNLTTHLQSQIDFGGFLKYSVSNNADRVPLSERLNIDFADEHIKQKVFQDATLVETPLILQLENVRDINNLPHYWRDLLNKIPEMPSSLHNDTIKDAISGISEALGGKLEYNHNKRRFEFIKKDFDKDVNVSVGNMASGEKVFGILQKLALNDMFGPDKIIILDEPENHLHPEWLVVLAEVLVKLSIVKCPILITSHSPDLIQAIRLYAKKYNLSQLKMYLADFQTHVIEDKTNKEYEIFDNLSGPINEIFKFSITESLS